MSQTLETQDLRDLHTAVSLLTAPSLTAKMTSMVGSPVEYLMDKLPKGANEKIHGIIETALHKVVDVSASTMENQTQEASNKWHKFGAGVTGALGGFFGFSALLVELPVSTTIMMRSILDVARSEGFDITDYQTKMECIAVFGVTVNEDKSDDSAESGYYASRIALNQIMNATAKELSVLTQQAANKAIDTTAVGKVFAQLIHAVATRLGVPLTEKAAAQLVPGIGALAGATLNVMFTDFYQDIARGHFIIKRLEEKYGADEIKAQFDKIRLATSKPAVLIGHQPE
ncbi:EcsC family protein [Pelistega suis]|uniref:EcsC family protein n=1 Tax=Pelistega suis TaxID=1631957 RepID=A0A849P3A6_9BURK|nr:EcsC family protein [Pelistega suis]NOL51980.1 EcsC family protein [Pelistega suis]